MDFKHLAGKAMDLAQKNADKLDVVIDKAGDLIDEKTANKYTSQVDSAQEAAKKALRAE
ncbi:antitoxin [Nocardia sp. NPDC049220]|uniref:antitoxin n=1 Tax=Nocardia sp. NPDC049220 TaxID=3155273 RepID=UPI0034087EF9